MASKDVLWEGRWTFPDGRVLTVGPDDLERYAHTARRMLASGLPLPWCWDHQPGVGPVPVQMSQTLYSDPEARAAAARNTINVDTTGVRVEERDHKGRKRKVLVAEFDDGRLTAEQKAAVAAAGRVSCRVDRNLWDARGNGRVYKGLCISHIAVTPRALEPDQGPFQMSATAPELIRGKSDEHFYMASGKYDGDEPDGGDEGAGVAAETAEPDAVDPAILTADTAPPPLPPEPAGPPPELQSVIASLKAMGIALPADEIADWKQLDLLLKSLSLMGIQARDATGGDPDADLTATVGAGAPPMLMSQSQMYASQPDIVERHRKGIRAGIAAAHRDGQLSGPMHDQFLAEFQGDSFEMSYYPSGRLKKNRLIADLDALRRRVPRGTFGRRSAGDAYDMAVSGFDAAAVGEVPPPARYRERDGAAKLDDLMEESFARMGLPKAKPAAPAAA